MERRGKILGVLKKGRREINYIWLKESEYKTTIIPKFVALDNDRG